MINPWFLVNVDESYVDGQMDSIVSGFICSHATALAYPFAINSSPREITWNEIHWSELCTKRAQKILHF